MVCFRGMDNNSNHTSVFVDTRRYAKHFGCTVSFNLPETLCNSYYSCFVEEADEAQQGWTIYPKSQSRAEQQNS